MSAFNTVKTRASCPFCDNSHEWTIQFKYGNCCQYEYRVGNKLRWGGNRKGQNVGGLVRTAGIAEERCKSCGKDYVNAAVYFCDNIIERVELLRRPLQLKDYYELV